MIPIGVLRARDPSPGKGKFCVPVISIGLGPVSDLPSDQPRCLDDDRRGGSPEECCLISCDYESQKTTR